MYRIASFSAIDFISLIFADATVSLSKIKIANKISVEN